MPTQKSDAPMAEGLKMIETYGNRATVIETDMRTRGKWPGVIDRHCGYAFQFQSPQR